jgi:hypothetical protein
MNVEVILNDGTKLFPSFDPTHSELIKVAYSNLYKFRQIAGYIIRDNNNQIVQFNV